MYLFLNLLALFTFTYLFVTLAKLMGLTKPSLNKSQRLVKKQKEADKRYLLQRDKFLKKYSNLYNWFSNEKMFYISEDKKNKLAYIALRMNKTKYGVTFDGKMLYVDRCLYTCIFVLASFLLGFINYKLIAIALTCPIVGVIFDYQYELQIRDIDKLIGDDFYDLYSDVYSVYKYPDLLRENFDQVILSYEPRANEATKYLISLVRADAKVSEAYALDKLKENFRIVKIHRMVDQVKLIAMGRAIGLEGLHNFKSELDAEREFQSEKALQAKLDKLVYITYIPMSLLFLLVGMWSLAAIK